MTEPNVPFVTFPAGTDSPLAPPPRMFATVNATAATSDSVPSVTPDALA